MNKKEYVEKAMAIWNEDTYCQNVFAIDENGNEVSPTDENACKWCVVGIFLKFPNGTIGIGSDYWAKYNTNLIKDSDKFGVSFVKPRLLALYE